MNVTIATIAESNAESFRECLHTVAKEKKYIAQIEALPIERIKEFVRESVQNDAVQFVALNGPDVIGWCDIFPAWAHAVKHCGSLGMGVLPEYRGQGVGEKLILACIAKAKTKGITRIELEVRVDNQCAIKLYEKVGFIHEARKRNAMQFDGIYYDAVLMSLIAENAP